MEGRRDGLKIEAKDPLTGDVCEVFISHHRMQTVGKRGLLHANECAHTVREILQNPTAIFEGLRRDQDEDPWGAGWRCYCGIPECAFRQDGTKRPPYPGQVYLVFVNSDGVAYNWRWEKADPDEPELPQDYSNRFRTQLL